ncbi:hypothetical protein TNCV_494831 [Trichonephila clavipes]|nr:hypothetical protein TNCV_494831 [Trichonephila clavipes]
MANFQPWTNPLKAFCMLYWCFTIVNLCDPRKLVSLFSMAPYRRIPIAAGNCDVQYPPWREAPKLLQCEPVVGLNFVESTQANQTL